MDDYVYYRKDNVFEKGERYEILTPFKTAITYSILCEHMHVDATGNSIEDSFNAFTKMHIVSFMNQKKTNAYNFYSARRWCYFNGDV